MTRKNFTEYQRMTPIEPPSLYYLLLSIIVILGVIFANGICYFLFMTYNIFITITDIILYILIDSAIMLYFFPYKMSRERTLIHQNGIMEIFPFNHKHQTIPISEISRIFCKTRWTLCGDTVILVIETTYKKKIQLVLKENKEFLVELKQYNPKIIIQNLPEL